MGLVLTLSVKEISNSLTHSLDDIPELRPVAEY